MFKSGQSNAMYRKGTSLLNTVSKNLGGASGILKKGIHQTSDLVNKVASSELGQKALNTKEGKQAYNIIQKGLAIGSKGSDILGKGAQLTNINEYKGKPIGDSINYGLQKAKEIKADTENLINFAH